MSVADDHAFVDGVRRRVHGAETHHWDDPPLSHGDLGHLLSLYDAAVARVPNGAVLAQTIDGLRGELVRAHRVAGEVPALRAEITRLRADLRAVQESYDWLHGAYQETLDQFPADALRNGVDGA